MAQDKDAARHRVDLQGEIDSASLYRALADAEADPQSSAIFRKLAALEDAHAEFWRKNLNQIGAQIPAQHPRWRSRILAGLARRFGPEFAPPSINVLEHVDRDAYGQQPEAVERGLPAAERSHARVLDVLAGKSGVRSRSARMRPP